MTAVAQEREGTGAQAAAPLLAARDVVAQFVVRGHVMAVCPRCAELNETDSAPPPPAEPPRPAA